MIRNEYNPARRIDGFTIIELMAVIGIMITVLFIALPALSYVRIKAKAEAVKAFMGMVNVGLINYNRDHKDVPPSVVTRGSGNAAIMFGLNRSVMTNWEGAHFLCQALTGASNNDGKAGMGYVQDGVTIDTYIASHDRIYDWNSKKFLIDFKNTTDFSNANRFLLTGLPGDEPSPILYYQKQPTGEFDKLISARGIWSASGQYSTKHNERLVKEINGSGGGDSVKDYFSKAEADGGANDMDRDGLERSLRGAKYLMVWPGSDFKYGTSDDVLMTGP